MRHSPKPSSLRISVPTGRGGAAPRQGGHAAVESTSSIPLYTLNPTKAHSASAGRALPGGARLRRGSRRRPSIRFLVFTLAMSARARPQVTHCLAAPGHNEAEVLQLAAAVERGSSHPLAAAIVGCAAGRQLPLIGAVQSSVSIHGQVSILRRHTSYVE